MPFWHKLKVTRSPWWSLVAATIKTCLPCQPFGTWLSAMLVSEETSWLFEYGSRVRKLLFFSSRTDWCKLGNTGNVAAFRFKYLGQLVLLKSDTLAFLENKYFLFLNSSMSSSDNHLNSLGAKPLMAFCYLSNRMQILLVDMSELLKSDLELFLQTDVPCPLTQSHSSWVDRGAWIF